MGKAARFWITVLVCCGLVVTFANDAVAKKKNDKDKDGTERRPFQILKPTVELTPAEGYAAVREIGGVRVELTSTPFTVKPMYFISVQPRESALESWTGIRVGQGAPVWIGILPFYSVAPKNVELKVKITNHLGRVLRLEGVALQFVKDGETLETDTVGNTLTKVIILPEKSWEGTLQGPTLEAFGLKEFNAQTASGGSVLHPEAIGKEGVLLVGLYDVITEMDEASTPKKRSNFEWVFAYKAKTEPEDAEAWRWKAKITEEQAKKIVGEHSPDDFSALLPGGPKP